MSEQATAVPGGEAASPLRVVRPKDPMRALGMAVSYLMRQPSFAALPFGHWSRTLVGQINRGHYLFAARGAEPVGFLGWAFTNEAAAEDWLAGRRGIPGREANEGDCLLINAWQASDPEANAFILDQARRIALTRRLVYAKRYYPSGRTRPVKVPIGDFLAGRIAARALLSPDTPPSKT